MSFHAPDSELAILNRCAHRGAVAVHPWTWKVLRACADLHRASDGMFDPAVAAQLVQLGLLPRPQGSGPDADVSFAEVQFHKQRRIRFARPLWIDLGGIAKGFAVDVAVATLRAHGVRQGTVNAGGDLRVFGPEPAEIWIRCPDQPTQLARAGTLRNGACATSGDYFSARGDSWFIVPPRRRAPIATHSVTVLAKSCMLADALTKIVALDVVGAAPVLARYGAQTSGLH